MPRLDPTATPAPTPAPRSTHEAQTQTRALVPSLTEAVQASAHIATGLAGLVGALVSPFTRSTPPPPLTPPAPNGLDVRSGRVAPTTKGFGPAFEAACDRDTGSVARPNNKVDLLFDGVQSFAERDRIIDSATTSIHLQTFIFTDDEVGWALARKLAAKAQQRPPVDVRVIVDAFGSQKTDDKLFRLMKNAGVDVRFREFFPNDSSDLLAINRRWHEKHLIVDGKVSVEGGMNIADEYALGGSGEQIRSHHKKGKEPWRDTDVRVEGEAVNDAQRAFLKNWELCGGRIAPNKLPALFPRPTVVAGGADVRVIQHHPSTGDKNIEQLYLHAIRTASTSITIENAYFIPSREMREAFKEAAKRGVDVRVLTNGKASGNHSAVVEAAQYFYAEMIEAGVKIYEHNGPSTVHSKVASFDGLYSIVGSANLNGRSDGQDTEVAVGIKHAPTAATMDKRFDGGVKNARAVTLDEAKTYRASWRQWALSNLRFTL